MNTSVEREPTPSVPQVSIGFLLFFTFCCAVLIAISLRFETAVFIPLDAEPAYKSIMTVWQVAGAVLNAILISTALLMAYSWLARRGAIGNQPGHWMIAAFAVNGLVTVLFFSGLWDDNRYDFAIYLFVGFVELGVATLFAFGVKRCTEKFWQWQLILFACASILYAYSSFSFARMIHSGNFENWPTFLFTWRSWAPWVLFAGVVWLAAADLATRTKRDWIHWLAIVCYFMAFALPELVRLTVRHFDG